VHVIARNGLLPAISPLTSEQSIWEFLCSVKTANNIFCQFGLKSNKELLLAVVLPSTS